MVVPGGLNARLRNEVIWGIVGQYEISGRNESGVRLLEVCAEQELVVGNSLFKKKLYNCTWVKLWNEGW